MRLKFHLSQRPPVFSFCVQQSETLWKLCFVPRHVVVNLIRFCGYGPRNSGSSCIHVTITTNLESKIHHDFYLYTFLLGTFPIKLVDIRCFHYWTFTPSDRVYDATSCTIICLTSSIPLKFQYYGTLWLIRIVMLRDREFELRFHETSWNPIHSNIITRLF